MKKILFLAIIFFAPAISEAAVLYDYSTQYGDTGTIDAGVQNGTMYGTSGAYSFGSPTMTGSFAYFKIQLASGSTCPSGSGVVGYTSAGAVAFSNPTPTYDAGDNTCTYPISASDIKAIFFSNSNNTANDGIQLNVSPSNDLVIVNGNAGSVINSFYGFSFQLCDSGGCTGGFSPPGPPSAPPDPFGNTDTHVIRITEPALYATTTSPFQISFDVIISEAGSSTDGYELRFTSDSGCIRTRLGLLPSGWAIGSPFTIATTSDFLSGHCDGPQTLSISLWGGVEDKMYNSALPLYGPGYFTSTHFAYNANTYSSVLNYTSPAYQGPQFASTTCHINFLGTFQLGDCIGYLVQPASSTMAMFNGLTLENRFPFAYMYGIDEMRQALFTVSSSSVAAISVDMPGFGTITFLSQEMIAGVPFADTIKTILTALMWLLTLELLYVSLLRSHNNHTGV